MPRLVHVKRKSELLRNMYVYMYTAAGCISLRVPRSRCAPRNVLEAREKGGRGQKNDIGKMSQCRGNIIQSH